MRVLLIEDNKSLCKTLKEYLRNNEIECDAAYDGAVGLSYALQGFYDVILLDIALPKKSGIDILTAVRKEKITTPVLMLTAKDTIDDKEMSFEFGADDYLTKPFLHKELLIRVKALVRRSRNMLDDSHIQIGKTRINLFNFEIEMNGKTVNASIKEAKLLELLFKNKDKYLSKEFLLNAVWGIDKPLLTNNVEVYIHMLRKNFQPALSGFKIVTRQGFGYKLEEVIDDV